MQNCEVCGTGRDEQYMLYKNDKYYCDSDCYNTFYQTSNIDASMLMFTDALQGFGQTLNGFTGKSAYQEWLDLGNTGDISAFLLSLKGADAVLTPEQIALIAAQIDISMKVDKQTGYSLVADGAIGNIHAPRSDDQDLSNLVVKVTGKGLSTNDLTNDLKEDYDDASDHAQSTHAPSNAVALSTVKTDIDVASAISLKHANGTDHAPGSDNQDLSNLVVKVANKSLVLDTEIAKIHSNTLDHSNSLDHSHSNKTTLDSYTQTEVNLASAVSLKHSNTLDHSNASDHTHTNASVLNAIQESLTTALKAGYDTAVTHADSAHAPSTAQKNSDITKAEIESKLTGEISTHTHAASGGNVPEFVINVQALTSSPTDSQIVYFGMLPKAPTTTAATSKIYIRKSCTLKHAEIYVYSGTAGTNEAWSLYVRKNNTTDTLIATVSAAASERVFTNAALNISLVTGDYIEIKGVQPTWATNPATTIYGGYLYFE